MVDGVSSKLIERVVDHFAALPGIGRKTALRFALHLLNKEKSDIQAFADALVQMRETIQYCESCHNISDQKLCSICSSTSRKKELICVVQDIRDVIAIENTHSHPGIYHVLGGVISPMDGVGPNDLNIASLIAKVQTGEIDEVIFALPVTMEGDTTNFYIYRQLEKFNITVTTLARGVSVGEEIEYTDQLTLGKSIQNRTLFSQTLKS